MTAREGAGPDPERVEAAAIRLRRAANEEQDQREADGFEAGLGWAFERALPSELEIIARLNDEDWLNFRPEEGVGTLWSEFDALGCSCLDATDAFSRGFVRGASEGWWATADLEGA